MSQIEILDRSCGSGKTTSILKWVSTNPHEKYLYISPFLEHASVDKLSYMIPDVEFCTPIKVNGFNKSDSLLEHLKNGRNVTSTHSLFKLMTDEHLEYVKNHNYIIIIDEECELITQYNEGMTTNDVKFLLSRNCISIDYDNFGKISWISTNNPDEVNFKYDKFKNMCNLDMIYCSKHNLEFMTVHLPLRLLTTAQRIIVCTYMFDGSLMDCFVRMKGIKTVAFTDIEVIDKLDKQKLKQLITIEPPNNYRVLDKFSMSTTWYSDATPVEIDLISKAIRNFAKYHKVDKCDVMYTCPSKFIDMKNKIYGYDIDDNANIKRTVKSINPIGFQPFFKNKDTKEYEQGCWVGCSSRATNSLRHKTVLIHAFNRFPLQALKVYMNGCGFPIDNDKFALSEMIQWVYRSAIRDDIPIKLCILSKRMRLLFTNWLNE